MTSSGLLFFLFIVWVEWGFIIFVEWLIERRNRK
jgi:hypothetical protein